MYRLTKAQRKMQERIEAWLEGQPFRENSRDKNPRVPDLRPEDVMFAYLPKSDPKDTGQFFTPPTMAQVLTNHIYIPPGARVLEPCAGTGALLQPIRPLEDVPDITVDAYELDYDLARLGPRLHPWANWHHASAYECMREVEGKYDVVLMNPPFNVKWATYQADEHAISGATKSEHLFLELACRALKPHGQAAIIGPYNLLDRMPKAMQKWFWERMELAEDLGQLPGEFALTNIRVHGFILTRKSDPAPVVVEKRQPTQSLEFSAVLETEVFRKSLRKLVPVAVTSPMIPALKCVKLDLAENGLITAQCSNIETVITDRFAVETVGQAGQVVAPAKGLLELLKLIEEPVISLSVQEGHLLVEHAYRQAKMRTRFNIEDIENFPDYLPPEGFEFPVDTERLAEAMRQVLGYAQEKGGEYFSEKIKFSVVNGALTLVSTNGVALAVSSSSLDGVKDVDFIVPATLASHVTRLIKPGGGTITINEREVVFNLDQAGEVRGPVLETRYVNYQHALRENKRGIVQVGCGDLRTAVKMALKFTGDVEIPYVMLTPDKEKRELRLGILNEEGFKGSVWANLEGEPMEIAFDGNLLLKTLKPMDADEIVTIKLEAANVAAVMDYRGTEYTIMPSVMQHKMPVMA